MSALVAISIAVLNSLWAAALITGLVWLAMRFARRMNAATRFAIWWAVLVVVMVLPVAPGMISSVRQALEPEPIAVSLPRYASVPAPGPIMDLPPLINVAHHSDGSWPLWLAAAWALAFVYGAAKLMRSYFYLAGVKRRAALSSDSLPQTGRAAVLLFSPEIDSPIAAGFARPAVILPDSFRGRLSPEEMRHVLLHESAHLARWDDWTNLLARLLRAAVLFHPVALWILHRIEIEREAACDDWVVGHNQSPKRYAQTLLRLYELRAAERAPTEELLATGIFGGGSRLAERIETLVRRSRNFAAGLSIAHVCASASAVVALAAIASVSPAWIALAQAPRHAFEVASIRRRTEESKGITFAARPGGRLDVVNNSIANVIDNAVGILPYQLFGVPDWVNSERYDIEAKGPGPAGEKEIMLMLQTLLADRFAMKSHFETREMSAYLLTTAKGGAKMRFLTPNDCIPYDDTRPNTDPGANICGNNSISGNGVWSGNHISMYQVRRALSIILRGPIIDRTDIKGTFDVHLEWSNDLTPRSGDVDVPPSISSAVSETLGLEVKSGRGPVEVLVTDHIERPTEN